ncbi:large ribosomal subunit protein uL30-like [Corticium candelabrum]|uniref:large ribosomal subunit protein uL30-like n=1 Tax=Corticium candelabrum TaxID=121492 RepID=UPI002E272EDD|nr:large ribosomal subunit protein uL30-like [Corticium candelabrum]
MSGRQDVTRLLAVTLVRSSIGRPYWEKRTLEVLKLGKLHQTVVHKNTPSVNGMLRSVNHLIDVKPLNVHDSSSHVTPLLTTSGDFYVNGGLVGETDTSKV